MKLEIGDFPVTSGNYAAQVRHGFRPRRDLKPVKITVPVDWEMDPFQDRNWRFQLHAWRMLPAIWSEFLARRNGKVVVTEIMPWIRDWHRYHVVEGRSTEMTWHDMATGVRSQHLALLGFLQARGEIALPEPDQALVRELATEHIRRLLDEEFIARGNHAIFQLVGLRMLGEVFPDLPRASEEADYATGLMARLLKSQFGPLGVHVENSPSYHHFAVEQFGRINPSLFPALESKFRKTLNTAREVEPWFGMPDGSIVAFGDSEGVSKAVLQPSAQGDLETRSDDGRRLIARDLSPAGYAIVRTGPEVPLESASMLAVKTQCLSSGHAQADHLTFELFEQGRRLIVDSGKYTYDTTHWRRYFKSDRAHNVVGLAHRDFDPGSTPPGSAAMSKTQLSNGIFFVSGHVVRSRDFKHSRTFEYQPGMRLRIRDRVALVSGRPVAYFHLAPDLHAEVGDDGGSVNVVDASGLRRMRFVFDMAILTPRIVKGQVEPHVQGWYSPSYRVKQAASVVELAVAPGVNDWLVDLEITPVSTAVETMPAAPWPISLPRRFRGQTRVRSVNKLLNREGGREFRALLEHSMSSARLVHRQMIESIIGMGYRLTASGRRQNGLGASFLHEESGASLRLLVRTGDVYPLRFKGMQGTIYVSLSEKPAPV